MLEEKPRLVMQDGLADVEEQKLAGFEHIGAHWPERQELHVGRGADHFRYGLAHGFGLHRQVGWIFRTERRTDGIGAVV